MKLELWCKPRRDQISNMRRVMDIIVHDNDPVFVAAARAMARQFRVAIDPEFCAGRLPKYKIEIREAE